MLQQSSPFNPFMQEFVFFARIARFTCQNNVAWVISSATRYRNNMIDFVGFLYRFPTVIASHFLAYVLFIYIFIGITIGLFFKNAPLMSVPSIDSLIAFGVMIAFLPGFNFIWIAFCPFFVVFITNLLVTMIVIKTYFTSPLDIVFSPFLIVLMHTLLAVRIQSIFCFTTLRKIFRSCHFQFVAMNAALNRSFHNASLSLYHMMASADGVIFRRSVINLADTIIISQKE